MSTTYDRHFVGGYPLDLPERWGFRLTDTEVEEVAGDTIVYLTIEIEASSGQEAEQRVLAVLDYDYPEDLHGAEALALPIRANDTQWLVTIELGAPF